jgi:antitoxin component of RelBE/YafQ-DinJ toxin-antitoxin module
MPKFKNNHIGFNVSDKLKKKTEEVSKEHEMSLADFMRYILQKYIDEYEIKKNK